MSAFVEKLRAAQQRTRSALCLRLDVLTTQLPLPMLVFDEPLVPFARAAIQATSDLVCAYAVAPDVFLAEGAAGMAALERITRLIPPDVPLVFDSAFGGDAWEAVLHARGAFEQFRADALTVSTLCEDVLAALAGFPGKGCFIQAAAENLRAVLSRAERFAAGLSVTAAQVATARAHTPHAPLWVRDAERLDASALASVAREGRSDDGLLPLLRVGQRVLSASRRMDFAEHMREAAKSLRDGMLALDW